MSPLSKPDGRQPSFVPGPGRPRGFDPGAALDAGVAIFRRRGFEATSLDELVSGMGISRSSFYSAFGSKHGVLVAALERYSALRLAELAALAGAPLAELLRALAGAGGDPRGCLLVNCISELCPDDPELRALAARHLDAVAAAVARAAPAAGPAEVQALLGLALGAHTLRKSGVGADQIAAMIDSVCGWLDARCRPEDTSNRPFQGDAA